MFRKSGTTVEESLLTVLSISFVKLLKELLVLLSKGLTQGTFNRRVKFTETTAKYKRKVIIH